MNKTVSFRSMTVEDIEAVMHIEQATFPTPWSRTAFYNEVVINHFATYLLLEVGEEIAGYCGVWVIIDEAHITNIALHPDFRGMKLGEALLNRAIDFAKSRGALKMTLEVRVSNKIAQNLYRKFGFEEGSIRKNYYTDNQEDALVMWVNFDGK
ncbi:ribosomal protein S18-alanine N-acetyltransferase [Pseudalkalibacillus hwajinpoensis]|uniref:[Ribosomal protein bS18]-alanine N-acetyltransferase n=1 Tax=Guptibacillus hwajinpoensis TaxID=208199 RepID=A0A4U1M8X3_9BACL|nr:ribosomal protein S18-alanine N-acetyltransferase [Pseudalkalibacillus hwajinpoensis]TKD66310.1 ribosomal-protein-alanine N-acetyltransferase [Pseudalkalibacillus hwajinpoensis]